MKGFFNLLFMFSISRIFDLLSNIVKGYFATIYLNVIEKMRSIFFLTFLIFVCALFILVGFLLLHVALFLYLPWEIKDKVILITILGATYVLVPFGLFLWLHSPKTWLKISGAKTLLDEISKEKKS